MLGATEGSTASLILIARAPLNNPLRFSFYLRHHAFDQVRGVQTASQVRVETKAIGNQSALASSVYARAKNHHPASTLRGQGAGVGSL